MCASSVTWSLTTRTARSVLRCLTRYLEETGRPWGGWLDGPAVACDPAWVVVFPTAPAASSTQRFQISGRKRHTVPTVLKAWNFRIKCPQPCPLNLSLLSLWTRYQQPNNGTLNRKHLTVCFVLRFTKAFGCGTLQINTTQHSRKFSVSKDTSLWQLLKYFLPTNQVNLKLETYCWQPVWSLLDGNWCALMSCVDEVTLLVTWVKATCPLAVPVRFWVKPTKGGSKSQWIHLLFSCFSLHFFSKRTRMSAWHASRFSAVESKHNSSTFTFFFKKHAPGQRHRQARRPPDLCAEPTLLSAACAAPTSSAWSSEAQSVQFETGNKNQALAPGRTGYGTPETMLRLLDAPHSQISKWTGIRVHAINSLTSRVLISSPCVTKPVQTPNKPTSYNLFLYSSTDNWTSSDKGGITS